MLKSVYVSRSCIDICVVACMWLDNQLTCLYVVTFLTPYEPQVYLLLLFTPLMNHKFVVIFYSTYELFDTTEMSYALYFYTCIYISTYIVHYPCYPCSSQTTQFCTTQLFCGKFWWIYTKIMKENTSFVIA